MGKAFADRWGVPVRAGSAEAVALLDSAIEDLAALAGDPVADADAAVAASAMTMSRSETMPTGPTGLLTSTAPMPFAVSSAATSRKESCCSTVASAVPMIM